MLEVDPRRRAVASSLIKDPYVLCEDVRMTAFEMASTVARTNNIKTFRRETIKVAHNKAVEVLVSFLLPFRSKKPTHKLTLSCASRKVYSLIILKALQIKSTHCTSEQ
jgi:hypothetical protein